MKSPQLKQLKRDYYYYFPLSQVKFFKSFRLFSTHHAFWSFQHSYHSFWKESQSGPCYPLLLVFAFCTVPFPSVGRTMTCFPPQWYSKRDGVDMIIHEHVYMLTLHRTAVSTWGGGALLCWRWRSQGHEVNSHWESQGKELRVSFCPQPLRNWVHRRCNAATNMEQGR